MHLTKLKVTRASSEYFYFVDFELHNSPSVWKASVLIKLQKKFVKYLKFYVTLSSLICQNKRKIVWVLGQLRCIWPQSLKPELKSRSRERLPFALVLVFYLDNTEGVNDTELYANLITSMLCCFLLCTNAFERY